jgi:HSP20 family protein
LTHVNAIRAVSWSRVHAPEAFRHEALRFSIEGPGAVQMAETAKVPVETERKTEAGAPAARDDAWMPFEALRREVDRLFDDFRPAVWRLPFARPSALEMSWPRSDVFRLAPAMDLVEEDGGYEITAELPGLDEKNVQVKLSNGTLSIRGEKKEETEKEEKEYHLSERRYGSFQRAFRVPEGVDSGKIEASFRNGVLTVKLPKSADVKASEKKIAVKAA